MTATPHTPAPPIKSAVTLLKHSLGCLANAASSLDSMKHSEALSDSEKATAADLSWQISKVKESVVSLATRVQQRSERKESR